MTTKNLLVELLVEELPPKALKMLGDVFAGVLFDQLKVQGLTAADSTFTAFASPRRLAVHVSSVAAQAVDKEASQKLMPVTVGLDASGNATPALLKKLAALGADASAVGGLKRAPDGKTEALFYDSTVKGVVLVNGLQKALEEAINRLPIPKVMTYQLADGWASVKFVRPVHRLTALHGATTLGVRVLGLQASNMTEGHRFESDVKAFAIENADSYEAQLLDQGRVIASFDARRDEIAKQLTKAAADVGGGVKPIEDEALLAEVTALVERPNVLVCEFEKEFLDVPQECLILTMKANQKYFPLLDAKGKLTNKFLVVSNISPKDTSFVIGGNERVVRPRLADAKFFFDKDRKTSLEDRVAGLDKVVYHNKLGTQGERTERVRAIAKAIGQQLGGDALAKNADTAARLAKADLLTDMVGEFPELQGIMGGYYARHDGWGDVIANAIEDHYKPRFAGDKLPCNQVGLVVALADKLETLVGMFGIGNLPSGDKDPFALRRHALGVIRMLMEENLPLSVETLFEASFSCFFLLGMPEENDLGYLARRHSTGGNQFAAFEGKEKERAKLLIDFVYERLAGNLREQGYSTQDIDAVLALRPQRLGDIPKRLAAVRAFAALPEAAALAVANKRISNILKREMNVDPQFSEARLKEPAEIALYAAMKAVVPQANAQFDEGDYTASLKTLAALRTPVDAFFDGVMVNAEDMDLRRNRKGLLENLHDAMNRVADLSRLVS